MDKEQAIPFGSEIEVDGVLYVSADFLLQYPDYLDNELDSQAVSADEAPTGPEEGEQSASTHKSELTINGVHYVALPMLMSNPNYIELKYKMKQDVSFPMFVPNALIGGAMQAAAWRRRRAGM